MNLFLSKLIKVAKYISPPLIVLGPLAPFINGMGCDFTFAHKGEYNYRQGYCKNGELTVYIKSNNSGHVYIKKMQWGYIGGYVYTYRLSNPVQPALKDISVFSALHDMQNLSIGYIIKSPGNKSAYSVYFQRPVETISRSNIKGKLGYYNTI